MYKIMALSKQTGLNEEIDSHKGKTEKDKTETEGLKNEYQIAYGDTFTIWVADSAFPLTDFKVGDKVLVNNDAWDEQLESMANTTKTYVVSELQNVPHGSGQWAKVEGGVDLVQHHDGEEYIDTSWISTSWFKKIS